MDLHSTIILHGNKDIVVGMISVSILVEQLPKVQLIVYPDSNHGTPTAFSSMYGFS